MSTLKKETFHPSRMVTTTLETTRCPKKPKISVSGWTD